MRGGPAGWLLQSGPADLDCTWDLAAFPAVFAGLSRHFFASAFYTRIIVTMVQEKGFCEAGTPGLWGGGGCAGEETTFPECDV